MTSLDSEFASGNPPKRFQITLAGGVDHAGRQRRRRGVAVPAAGAALDVYEKEPEIHAGLMSLDNVLLIPHLASATTETRTAMADLAVSNAIAVLNGHTPVTPVP